MADVVNPLNTASSTAVDAGAARPAATTLPSSSVEASAGTTRPPSSSQNAPALGSNNAVNTPASAPGNSGTSPGVIAGAAVGAAVGAAIITFIITFMFFRRKNQKQHHHGTSRSGSGGFTTYTEKALPKSPNQGDHVIAAAPSWQKHIPQSADDTTIRTSVRTLFDQVELHVENFYRDSAVSLTEAQQAELRLVDSPHLPDSVVALLPRARSQTALIKHCLLSYIVASISTDDNSVQSLLPAEYSSLPHLARASSHRKPAFNQALTHWRLLTTYLRPPPQTDPAYLSQRDSTIAAAATAFTTAFSPYANPAYADDIRRQNVADIFTSAAEVGVLVFSQASEFVYEWKQDGGRGAAAASVIVVTPALLKVADENAQRLERSQVMVQMATQSL